MRPILRYPGAKQRLLDALRPKLDVVCGRGLFFADVFVGGGSVVLDVARRYKALELVVNDLNPDVIGLWQCLVDLKLTNDLCRRLRVVPTVALFKEVKTAAYQSPVDRAFRAIFLNRCSFSGMSVRPIGGWNQTSSYGVGCRYNVDTIAKSIQECHRLLAGRTQVTHLNTVHLLAKMDDRAAVYADPPYYQQGRNLYSFYMDVGQHKALAAQLRQRENWVLSYDLHPEVLEMYAGYPIERVDAYYSISQQRRSVKQELIITSV